MMKPEINLALYSRHFHSSSRRGVAIYAHELAQALSKLLSQRTVFLLDCFWPRANFSFLPRIQNINFKTNIIRCPGRVFDFLNNKLGWPRPDMSIGEVDLLHVMHEQVPVTKSKSILMTVHDMGPLLYPELFTKRFRSAWKASLDQGLKLADKIIGVSKTVEVQLRKYRPEFSDKYHGILLGVSDEFLNNHDPELDKEFIISKGINFPYILYIGAADPKKNLLTFIEAYSLFLKETKPAPPHHVVLVGNTTWGGYGQFKHKTRDLGIDDRIHFTGYIDHQFLPALYRGSELFVFPSLFEGFGLPVLEAMASGAPCLISNRPALDEVGGNIAEYFDPEFPEDIAHKMKLLLEDPDRLAEMRIEGREYAQKFSWERTAKETIRIYEEVLGSTLV